ncbi:hypothetical protein D3C72_2143460 [compost metagenome]
MLIMSGPLVGGQVLLEMSNVASRPDLAGAVSVARHCHQPSVCAGVAGADRRSAAVAGVLDHSR